jgi:ubiquitin thioesterase protein OTUB1
LNLASLTHCVLIAIGFSYFEKLIEAGDQAQIDNEVSRLLNLNQTLATVGGYDYFEDFADETIDLLREVSQNMADPNMARTLLMQRWNDAGVTSSIIYHLRLLAATFLKSNVEAYADFIIDGTIQTYCSHSVELVNHEIEHLGLVALSNVLLKPCNFAMEVAYLDRSEGTEVNVYRFPEEAANQPDSAFASVVYLLYRPGHYDILYRAQTSPAIEAPIAPVSIQVHRVNGFTSNAAITGTQNSLGDFSNVDFSALAMIPGFGPGGAGISGLASPATSTTLSDPFSSVQQPPNLWGPQFCSPMGAPSPQAAPQQAQAVSPAAPPNPPAPTPMSPHTTRSNSTPMSQAHVMSGTSLASAPECTIRFSPMQLEYDGSKNHYPEPTFQVTTNTFKNSVWNRAHFGNPDFHPEEWSPEDENIDGRLGPKRKGGLRREI